MLCNDKFVSVARRVKSSNVKDCWRDTFGDCVVFVFVSEFMLVEIGVENPLVLVFPLNAFARSRVPLSMYSLLYTTVFELLSTSFCVLLGIDTCTHTSRIDTCWFKFIVPSKIPCERL